MWIDRLIKNAEQYEHTYRTKIADLHAKFDNAKTSLDAYIIAKKLEKIEKETNDRYDHFIDKFLAHYMHLE